MNNNTKDKIRQVAFTLFLEKGYEATSIRDICKEVEIKPSSIYFHYKSKQELFFEIYEEIWQKKITYMKDIKEVREDITPKMKLYYLYKKVMEFYIQDISKQKFLLRYHLFQTEELTILIKDKYKFWKTEEEKLIIEIMNQCIDEKLLEDDKSPEEYSQMYKKFEDYQAMDMIVFNIRQRDTDIDGEWWKFWETLTSEVVLQKL